MLDDKALVKTAIRQAIARHSDKNDRWAREAMGKESILYSVADEIVDALLDPMIVASTRAIVLDSITESRKA